MAGQEENREVGQGRTRQKNRTRIALVAAARDLMQAGRQPTVSEAAEAAQISRATAYRYFPTQQLLLAEVALFASGGPLFRNEKDLPLPEALGQLVRAVGKWSFANEQQLRMLLRLSLDPSSGVRRPGHRREWIADALESARERMHPRTFTKLSRALTLLFGIDPVVVMRDIAGASEKDALDALEWAAQALVASALHEQDSSQH